MAETRFPVMHRDEMAAGGAGGEELIEPAPSWRPAGSRTCTWFCAEARIDGSVNLLEDAGSDGTNVRSPP